MNELLRKIPVSKGEELFIIPSGKGKKGDFFYNFSGFIIFLKNVPDGLEGRMLKVRVSAVKDNYAFAEFVSVQY